MFADGNAFHQCNVYIEKVRPIDAVAADASKAGRESGSGSTGRELRGGETGRIDCVSTGPRKIPGGRGKNRRLAQASVVEAHQCTGRRLIDHGEGQAGTEEPIS